MTRHPPKRLLALSALGGMLAACGSAPVDVPPPPGSEPVPPAVVDSPPPAEVAAPRLPDRSWLADEGPIFDWRAEGVIGSADTASAPADTASAPAEAAASAAVEAPDAAVPTGSADTAAPSVAENGAAADGAAAGAEPPAVVAGLPWYRAPGPIFDWSSERAATPLPAEPSTPLAPWQQRERRIRQLAGWRLSGRVAISAPDESWSAVVRWEQAGDAFHVRLSNPLGQGLADLRGVPGEVLLMTAEGAIYRAPDADTLLRDVAGLRLPVAGLRYWVLAVTDPDLAAADVTVDADALPEALRQGGWRVEYDRYRDTGNLRLPDRLSFEGDDLRGRLIITDWQVDGS